MMKNTMNNPSIKIRASQDRGHADHGWLRSYHTFSFADYEDEKYMNFRALRVINEDWVAPAQGFGMHPHRDMEIFTYVIEGALAHKDSMGNGSTIKPGQVQKMSAGTGVTHSEFNPSEKEHVHLLQIWIVPAKKGLAPDYQEFTLTKSVSPLTLIGSPKGGANIMQFNQDVYIYKGMLKARDTEVHALKSGRGVWLQLIKGRLKLNEHALSAGDGASIEEAETITLSAVEDAEFLLMDFA